jgi:hypothetical protein
MLSNLIRFFISLFILFYVKNLSILHKVVLVYMMDFLDSVPRKHNPFFHMINSSQDPNEKNYQVNDKVTDSILSFILLKYISDQKILHTNTLFFLKILLLLRLIGVFLFLKYNGERQFLIFFPNFFIEFLLVFIILKQFSFKIKTIYLNLILLFVFSVKVLQEIYLHQEFFSAQSTI